METIQQIIARFLQGTTDRCSYHMFHYDQIFINILKMPHLWNHGNDLTKLDTSFRAQVVALKNHAVSMSEKLWFYCENSWVQWCLRNHNRFNHNYQLFINILTFLSIIMVTIWQMRWHRLLDCFISLIRLDDWLIMRIW